MCRSRIRKAMLGKGLIDNMEVSNAIYYKAILDHQLANNLQVGIIDFDFIELLEVQFGY